MAGAVRISGTALYHPGDRQGPGHIENALATSYQHFWYPGGSEMVGGNPLQMPKVALMIKVKAKAKKVKVKKFKCTESHETQDF